jgi:cation diffusion facilitator CzcD-associated flavoprotein CzcO
VLEAQESFGGTWLTHKYPGIRSDSDLYTFGYRFKPWTGPPIATADEIKTYMGEVIAENDLARHIRYRHRIDSATWSSKDAAGPSRASAPTPASGALHRQLPVDVPGLLPPFRRLHAGVAGHGRFKGQIVHPQTWPEDLDYTGKQVVVIGSGATAATLVPAIAGKCGTSRCCSARRPTSFTGRNANELADMLRAARHRRDLDPRDRAPQDPARPVGVHRARLRGAGQWCGRNCWPACAPSSVPDYDIDRTSRRATGRGSSASPSSPTATCSRASRSGKASVVTDEIDRFTEKASCSSRGRCSRPTSSSRPPAST